MSVNTPPATTGQTPDNPDTRERADRLGTVNEDGTRSKAAMDPERLAQLFHETYERLAPSHGYETREASAVQWDDVPDKNKRLMVAVATQVQASGMAVEARSLPPFQFAREVMKRHFNEDQGPGDIYDAYQANVAMLLSDRFGIKDHDKRNEAAAAVLDLIFDLETTTTPV